MYRTYPWVGGAGSSSQCTRNGLRNLSVNRRSIWRITAHNIYRMGFGNRSVTARLVHLCSAVPGHTCGYAKRNSILEGRRYRGDLLVWISLSGFVSYVPSILVNSMSQSVYQVFEQVVVFVVVFGSCSLVLYRWSTMFRLAVNKLMNFLTRYAPQLSFFFPSVDTPKAAAPSAGCGSCGTPNTCSGCPSNKS